MIERILELMRKHGVRAKELTEKAGLNHSAVTDWKKGKSKPSTEAIVKLAEYFGVTTDYLLLGKEPQERLESEKVNIRMNSDRIRSYLGKLLSINGFHLKYEVGGMNPKTLKSIDELISHNASAIEKTTKNTDISRDRLEGMISFYMNKSDERTDILNSAEATKLEIMSNYDRHKEFGTSLNDLKEWEEVERKQLEQDCSIKGLSTVERGILGMLQGLSEEEQSRVLYEISLIIAKIKKGA